LVRVVDECSLIVAGIPIVIVEQLLPRTDIRVRDSLSQPSAVRFVCRVGLFILTNLGEPFAPEPSGTFVEIGAGIVR